MIVGNDVADYQGDINFDVYKNNSNFIIVKATEGTGFVAKKLSRNQSEARRVGLPLGYYHFARPEANTSPEAEAEHFLKNVGQLREGEFLALDYEPPIQMQVHVDWCKKFLDYCFQKTGIRPFIYMSESVVAKLDWKIVVDGQYALWIAKYSIPPNPETKFNPGEFKTAAIYQWTSSQKVPGIAGNVDGDVFYGTVEQLKKYGFKPAPPPPPPPPPATDWEKKYNDEVRAHAKTQSQLLEAAGEITTLNNRINTIKKFTASA